MQEIITVSSSYCMLTQTSLLNSVQTFTAPISQLNFVFKHKFQTVIWNCLMIRYRTSARLTSWNTTNILQFLQNSCTHCKIQQDIARLSQAFRKLLRYLAKSPSSIAVWNSISPSSSVYAMLVTPSLTRTSVLPSRRSISTISPCKMKTCRRA